MPATHKSTNYRPLPVSNPLNEGQDRAYGDLYLDAVKTKNNWQLIALGSLVLFAISLVLFYHSYTRQTTVPVLVNVLPSGMY